MLASYLQHLCFTVEAADIGADDRGALLQGEDISHKGVLLSLPYNHVCYLYYRVLFSFGEYSCKVTQQQQIYQLYLHNYQFIS